MEIFYPANRFLNFYIVPLKLKEEGGRMRDEKESGESASENSSLIPHPSSLLGHAIILRDITESRRSTEKTIESERFNALTLLAAGVAHEIGNPLNSLHIHLQLMERSVQKLNGDAKTELQQSIDIARSEVNRLDSIVTQFLRA